MKSTEEIKTKTFEKEYLEIMKGYNNQSPYNNQTPQWTNPNDFIAKFSLYQETPNSITSTNTMVTL